MIITQEFARVGMRGYGDGIALIHSEIMKPHTDLVML